MTELKIIICVFLAVKVADVVYAGAAEFIFGTFLTLFCVGVLDLIVNSTLGETLTQGEARRMAHSATETRVVESVKAS